MNGIFKRPAIGVARLGGLVAHLALILFSSTRMAAEYAEQAFRFYHSFLDQFGTGQEAHLLAQKGVHFVLFFSLGAWTYNVLAGARRRRFAWAVAFCFLIGAVSETMQLFTGRDAAVADALLNGASGLLGTALAWRWSAAPQLVPEVPLSPGD